MQSNVTLKSEDHESVFRLSLYAPPPRSEPKGVAFSAQDILTPMPNTWFSSSYSFLPLATSSMNDSEPTTSNTGCLPNSSPVATDTSTALPSDPERSPCMPTDVTPAESPPSTPVAGRVPRPPNAFMLFRSDFLKRQVIPSNVERRQQHLSRIAGQCWNLLPRDEKTYWQDLATKIAIDHHKRNPNYKFTPTPRNARQSKTGDRGNGIDDPNGEERIRSIRERYARIIGPAAPPKRQRKSKSQNRGIGSQKKEDENPILQHVQSPIRIPPPPLVLATADREEPPLPPFFPQHSHPHVIVPRRPSTSLGFSTPLASEKNASILSGLALTRPSSAASSETGLTTMIRDLDLTPTAAIFDTLELAMIPSSPVTLRSPHATSSPTGLRDAKPFMSLNPAPPKRTTPSPRPKESISRGAEEPTIDNPGALLESLYSCDSFAFLMDPQGPNPDPNQFRDPFHQLFDSFVLPFGSESDHLGQSVSNQYIV